MDTTETFQIPLAAAEAYETTFVPAIFAEWATRALDAGGVGPGTRLLDVACGTGIVARTARERGADPIVGVDLNDAMLTVARRCDPDVDWRHGDAAELPVDDDGFDVVVCQMAMMFFPDRRAALAEMARAVSGGGRVVLVVPAALDAQPAYRPFVEIAAELAGSDARSLLGTYWNCGDLDAVAADAAPAGLRIADRATHVGTARFESAADFVTTEIEGSPLAERIDAATASLIVDGVSTALARYGTDDAFEIPLVCHVVTMTIAR